MPLVPVHDAEQTAFPTLPSNATVQGSAIFVKSGSGMDLICSGCKQVLLKNIRDHRTAFLNAGLVVDHAKTCKAR